MSSETQPTSGERPASELSAEELEAKFKEASTALFDASYIPVEDQGNLQETLQNVFKLTRLVVKYRPDLLPQMAKVHNAEVRKNFADSLDMAESHIAENLKMALRLAANAGEPTDPHDLDTLKGLLDYVQNDVMPTAKTMGIVRLKAAAEKFILAANPMIASEEGLQVMESEETR